MKHRKIVKWYAVAYDQDGRAVEQEIAGSLFDLWYCTWRASYRRWKLHWVQPVRNRWRGIR